MFWIFRAVLGIIGLLMLLSVWAASGIASLTHSTLVWTADVWVFVIIAVLLLVKAVSDHPNRRDVNLR
jgi:hypothetical protein